MKVQKVKNFLVIQNLSLRMQGFNIHRSFFDVHPSSFQSSSFNLQPSSFQASSFIVHPSSFIAHPSSFNVHPSRLHPSSFNVLPFNIQNSKFNISFPKSPIRYFPIHPLPQHHYILPSSSPMSNGKLGSLKLNPGAGTRLCLIFGDICL
jgi:hypothetical protein